MSNMSTDFTLIFELDDNYLSMCVCYVCKVCACMNLCTPLRLKIEANDNHVQFNDNRQQDEQTQLSFIRFFEQQPKQRAESI